MITNAERFIDLVGKLYNLPEKAIEQMSANISEINSELGKYSWEDVEHKIQFYYVRKNDKSRPSVAHIIALLETDPNVIPLDTEPSSEPEKHHYYHRPNTNLFTIKSTFEKLVDILIAGGVITDSDGTRHNEKSLVDPDTDMVILEPIHWLVQKTDAAMLSHPEYFLPYKFATPLERVAVALQNQLITFKVRDWSKLTQK